MTARFLMLCALVTAILSVATGSGRTRQTAADSRRPVSRAAANAMRRPPNFVIIYADDLGWADTSGYGSRFYRTPNIDRLATQGVKFTNSYAAAPVCSPSRAALLTGKYPARLHLTDWLPGRPDAPAQKLLRAPLRAGLPMAELTIAERLKSAGYATASIGKWHLGGAGYGPRMQGFDLNIAGDEHGTPVSYFYPYTRGTETTPGLERGRAGEYLTDRLTDEAEAFINANRARSFLLYLPHYAVHIPMKAKPALIAKYESRAEPNAPQHNAIYAAMIESLDESVGRVVAQLERLGLLEDTVIIFTSDNGGLTVEEGPHTPPTSNAPLRDGKGFLYEGGIRVPLIVGWRGRIEPGRVCGAAVSGVDLFETIGQLAGLAPAATTRTDGRSLAPLLTGRAAPHEFQTRALYWHYPHYSNQGGAPGAAIREGRYKLIEFFEDGRLELYDLRSDPCETRNLAHSRSATAKRLLAKLRRWRASVGAQMMTPNPNYTGGAPAAIMSQPD